MQQEGVEFPPELSVRPIPLIGVSGLDTLNNAIHKAIWETFNNLRRTDKVCVSYKLIDNDYEFPVPKPKRTSYDWYIPKGILKRNWMKKHLFEIPAVVAIFYDLDWKDFVWNEKMIECASKVQSMRAALEGRGTKVVLVVIQNSPPLPSGEDTFASERAVALCSSCELPSSSLFVLPHGDHLQGYAYRLESAFFEAAQNYYHNEIRNIKNHKEHLNKNIHQYLLIRHQFKLGFLYELKQDIHTAHKHYSLSYNHLLDVRIVDTIAVEIRTIAGFINYKLCRLLFALNLPRDAISQFKVHIEKFKNRIGFQELAFEHYAWLSKQYCIFGELFEEAVKSGITPVQTQHPGLYYQQAAEHAVARKNTCRQLCEHLTHYPNPDPFESSTVVEYFGQRPWKHGKMATEQLDPQLECSGIEALQFMEKQINISRVIINLYGLAIQQFKTYKCPRTRTYLILQMADEYYQSGDYGKSLTLLTHMLYDLRTEIWKDLLSNILEKALNCAFITASIPDYVSLVFEILGKKSSFSQEKKVMLHQNINRIIAKKPPVCDSTLEESIIKNANVQWQNVFQSLPVCVSLDMGNTFCCIETKAKFLKDTFEVDEKVSIEVYVRNTSPFELAFSKISVTVNSISLSSEFAVECKTTDDLLIFRSNEIKCFLIEFMPDPKSINNNLQIVSVNLFMGKPGICCLELKFTNSAQQENISQELLYFKKCHTDINFDRIKPLLKTSISPRKSRLDVTFDHPSPALEGEWYGINVTIVNGETNIIKGFKAEISTNFEETDNCDISKTADGSCQKSPLIIEKCDQLNSKLLVTTFFIRLHKAGEKKLQLKISYMLSGSLSEMECFKLDNVIVPVVKPLEVTTKFLTTTMIETQKFFSGEDFLIMPVINCLSPWPIVIENTSLQFEYPIKAGKSANESKVSNMVLRKGESCVDMFLASCDKCSDNSVNIGQYSIIWKRENGIITTSQLLIIGCPVESNPLHIKLTMGAYGIVRTPLLVTYHLKNTSHQLMQINLNMEASEAFMFAGYKQFMISILPKSTFEVRYNLYPLITGKVALPKLTIRLPEGGEEDSCVTQDQIDSLLRRSLPKEVYIMPQGKGVQGDPISSAVKS